MGRIDEAHNRINRRLALQAKPIPNGCATGPNKSGQEVNEAIDDPHRLARLSANDHRHPDGVLTLVRWNDEYHRWDGNAYRAIPEDEIRCEVVARVKKEFDRLNALADAERAKGSNTCGKGQPAVLPVTRNLIGNVTQVFESLILLPSSVRQPSWLGKGPIHSRPTRSWLARTSCCTCPRGRKGCFNC